MEEEIEIQEEETEETEVETEETSEETSENTITVYTESVDMTDTNSIMAATYTEVKNVETYIQKTNYYLNGIYLLAIFIAVIVLFKKG